MKGLIVLAVCIAATCALEHPIFGDDFKMVRGADMRRGIADCKPLGHACSGFPKCCNNYQCFWEDGYSAFNDGVCVECVRPGQLCQRDAQCCSPLVCQKDRASHMDGVCAPKRARGQPCHEDDQCLSGDCDQKWYQFTEGKCE